jgi:adenosylhomocysteinase
MNFLKETYAEDKEFWHNISKNIKGVSEETTTGVHRFMKC